MGQLAFKKQVSGLLDLQPAILPYLLFEENTIEDAMQVIESMPGGFAIVTDHQGRLSSFLDRTRLHQLLRQLRRMETPLGFAREKRRPTPALSIFATREETTELFMQNPIDHLPVLDTRDRVVNCISKTGFFQFLCEDLPWDTMGNFLEHDRTPPEPVHRPWGFFRSLLNTDFCHTKILSLEPGQELSLQKHLHREEHWTIVRGSGLFRLEDTFIPVKAGDTLHIPRVTVHWLKNTGTVSLMLVEVQLGDAFDESDIIRLSDRYGRDAGA